MVPKSTDAGVAASAVAPSDVDPEDDPWNITPPHPKIPGRRSPIARYPRIAEACRCFFLRVEIEVCADCLSQILTSALLNFGS